jgi:hypothetical protein
MPMFLRVHAAMLPTLQTTAIRDQCLNVIVYLSREIMWPSKSKTRKILHVFYNAGICSRLDIMYISYNVLLCGD